MTVRTLITQFTLSNPLYKGASVAFMLVANGVKTSVMAHLFAATTGTAELPNPQKLSSSGKFKQAVYVEDQVIGVITGISVPSHDTGIISPAPTFMINGATGHLEYSFDGGVTQNDAGSTVGTGSPQVTFLHSGGGAFLEVLSDILNGEVRVESFMTDAQKASGLTQNAATEMPTPLVDCWSAFDDAGKSFPTNLDYSVYGIGGRVLVPRGNWYLDKSWDIERNLYVAGQTKANRNSFGGSRLWFKENTTGINFKWFTDTVSGLNGAQSVVEKLFIGNIQGGVSSLTGDGIFAETPIYVRDSWIKGFRRNGIRLDSIAGGVSESCIESTSMDTNGLVGLSISGGNANVVTTSNLDLHRNNSCGIKDQSFLGNTHSGAQASANGILGQISDGVNRYFSLKDDPIPGATIPGTDATVWELIGAGGVSALYPAFVPGNKYYVAAPYYSDGPNARNLFLGCYFEGGQAPNHMILPAQMIGGLHGPFDNETTAQIIGDFQFSAAGTNSADTISRASFPTSFASARRIVTRMGFTAGNNTMLNALITGDASQGFDISSWDESTGTMMIRHAANVNRIPVRFTTDLSNLSGGRTAPIGGGQILFPQGIFIGGRLMLPSTALLRMIGNQAGNADPVSGNFAVGDALLNTTPSSGAFMGITATVAGTMGTLNGGTTTGTITTGTKALTLSSATGAAVGQFITIAGVTGVKCITALVGTAATIDVNADASVGPGAAVAFSPATFKTWGLIS